MAGLLGDLKIFENEKSVPDGPSGSWRTATEEGVRRNAEARRVQRYAETDLEPGQEL